MRWVAGLAIAVSACGPSVASDPLVTAPPRVPDEEVLVFVRSERPPACPWEVLGSLGGPGAKPIDEGSRLAEAKKAAARMGGDAVLFAAVPASQAQVIRFLDPRSLCDPHEGPTRRSSPDGR